MADTKPFAEIGSRLADLQEPLKITFHPAAEPSDFSSALGEIAEALSQSAGDGVALDRGDGEGLPGRPALSFHFPGGGTVHYLAYPEKLELEPFREMVLSLTDGADGVSGVSQEPLKGLPHPAALQVFVAPTCPNCPRAAGAAMKAALFSPAVTTLIIDVQRFMDLAEPFHIQSVPVTVIDGELLIREAVPLAKLTDHLRSRGTAEYAEATLLSLVESGLTASGAARLRRGGVHGKAFASLWSRSTLTSRMGLMVVAEEAMEEGLADPAGLVSELASLLDTEDVALRGDTADLLGQIGHPSARPALEALLEDNHPDVAEIAEEALESIEGRDQP